MQASLRKGLYQTWDLTDNGKSQHWCLSLAPQRAR